MKKQKWYFILKQDSKHGHILINVSGRVSWPAELDGQAGVYKVREDRTTMAKKQCISDHQTSA